MPGKPPGSIVTLTYDCERDREVEPGDVIQSPTGRRYLIDRVRVVERRSRAVDPVYPVRFKTTCVVMHPDDEYEGVTHPFVWYER